MPMISNTKETTFDDAQVSPSIKPITPISEPPSYGVMLHGTGTDRFGRITLYKNSKNIGQEDKIGQKIIKDDDMTVFIQKYKELAGNLSVSTHKLLRICTLELTRQNTYRTKTPKTNVFVPLSRYMELCNIPNNKPYRDKIRRAIWESLDMLFSISIEWTEKKRDKQITIEKMRICDYAKFETGGIQLNFSKPMAQYIINSFPMNYPFALFKLDSRNENAFFIGEKLSIHNSIKNNQIRGTANIISIESLLRVTNLPSYDTIREKDRHYSRHIIEPFDNALESLVTERVLKEFTYCSSNGIKLSTNEREELLKDYKVFIKVYVYFVLEGIPSTITQMPLNFNEQEDKDDDM